MASKDEGREADEEGCEAEHEQLPVAIVARPSIADRNPVRMFAEGVAAG